MKIYGEVLLKCKGEWELIKSNSESLKPYAVRSDIKFYCTMFDSLEEAEDYYRLMVKNHSEE